LNDELDTSYYSNALNEADFAALNVDELDVAQLLNARLHDPDKLPLHLIAVKPVHSVLLLLLSTFGDA